MLGLPTAAEEHQLYRLHFRSKGGREIVSWFLRRRRSLIPAQGLL